MKKFRLKSILALALMISGIFVSISCKSTSFAEPEMKERMYWSICGTDSKGNPSTVHILGTIHVGDERLYPLPSQVMDDFENADRLVAEISSEDMDALQGELIKSLITNLIKAQGRNVMNELSESELETLFSVLDETIARPLGMYEPWLLTNTISVFQYASCGLDATKGVDQFLMDKAKKDGRSWEGLDTLQLQIDVMQFGTYEEQLAVLKSILLVLENPEIFNNYINNLYEAYLAGDEKAMLEADEDEEELMGESDPMLEEYSKNYNEALLTKRNKAWAEKIRGYLNDGGETFIFAGSMHFLGKDSVFSFLGKK